MQEEGDISFGKQTILIIDQSDELEHCLNQTIKKTESVVFGKYNYQCHRFWEHAVCDDDFFKNLSMLLNFSGFEKDSLERAAMQRLRAVIFFRSHLACPDRCYRLIRTYHPSVPVFSIDYRSIISDEDELDNKDFFYRMEENGWKNSFPQHFLKILSKLLDSRYHTPYWSALQALSRRKILSFHALPIGQDVTSRENISDFIGFYGKDFFDSETSLSTLPLDSPLNPKGPLLEAQKKAAIAFGAISHQDDDSQCCGTKFVTAGTSSANRIVISAFVLPDDYVLLDRSCHISHHSALACAYAKPIFMRPFTNVYGISGPTTIKTVGRAFEYSLSEYNRAPALVILNNPTFDGIYCRPEQVILEFKRIICKYWDNYHHTDHLNDLLKSLSRYQHAEDSLKKDLTKELFIKCVFRGIVFLFDEAWSAYAHFHPQFVRYTAMHAVFELTHFENFPYRDCLRVYATQSTHKSLNALRQGSMIHYRDPLLQHHEWQYMFKESYRAQTTTSPSANILASLDVARRQAETDGMQMIDTALQFAEEFRKHYRKPKTQNGFFAVSPEQMMRSYDGLQPDLSPEQLFLDPTHITISWNFPIEGFALRRLLLAKDIQVNKFAHKSILAIFHIGIDRLAVEKLYTVLIKLSYELERHCNTSNTPAWLQPAWPEIAELSDTHNLGYWFKNLGNRRRRLLDVESALKCFNETPQHCQTYFAATFVTPYPPGFPILVPGQLVELAHLEILQSLAYSEVHGADFNNGKLCILVYDS